MRIKFHDRYYIIVRALTCVRAHILLKQMTYSKLLASQLRNSLLFLYIATLVTARDREDRRRLDYDRIASLREPAPMDNLDSVTLAVS